MRFSSRHALLAAAVLVCGCNRGEQPEREPAPDTARPVQPQAQPAPIQDPQILHILQTANSIESELGDLAADRAVDAITRNYARTVAADHRALNQVVDSVARMVKMIPADNEVSREMRAKSDTVRAALAGRTEAAFDRAYIPQDIQAHQMLLDRIERDLMRRTLRPEILQLLERVRPMLAAHLQMALDIQKRIAPTAAQPQTPQPQPPAPQPQAPRPKQPPTTTTTVPTTTTTNM